MVKRYSIYQKFVQEGTVRTTKSVGVVEDLERGEYIKYLDHLVIMAHRNSDVACAESYGQTIQLRLNAQEEKNSKLEKDLVRLKKMLPMPQELTDLMIKDFNAIQVDAIKEFVEALLDGEPDSISINQRKFSKDYIKNLGG